jgi:hypothetical protein
MSEQGTTTTVKIHRPGLDPADQTVLCSAICQCKNTPGIGKDGRSLKQSCVSNRLKQCDAQAGHQSIYKAEVNYDMTQRPPVPIMDKEAITQAHDWLPGWIRKYWDTPPENGGRRPQFRAGEGLVRRPDVVIVKDPAKPPTQENIKKIVEIKFPPDKRTLTQKRAYGRIAGDENKVEFLGPQDCNCAKPDPETSTEHAARLGPAAAAVAGLLYLLLTRRPPPRPAFGF